MEGCLDFGTIGGWDNGTFGPWTMKSVLKNKLPNAVDILFDNITITSHYQ